MKFLRLLSKSAFQEMTYTCADSNKDCTMDLKGDNEMIVNNLDKIKIRLDEVCAQLVSSHTEYVICCQYNWGNELFELFVMLSNLGIRMNLKWSKWDFLSFYGQTRFSFHATW